jgi:3-mercaptopyruvate sulfurtransferase SseA
MSLNRTVIIILAAVIAALSALWLTNGAVTPREATWNDVLAEAKNGGYGIITTQDLASAYSKNPNEFFLVDTRQEWEYRTGHIKGAINFPMEPTWWSRWRRSEALQELLGPDKERKVVFY